MCCFINFCKLSAWSFGRKLKYFGISDCMDRKHPFFWNIYLLWLNWMNDYKMWIVKVNYEWGDVGLKLPSAVKECKWFFWGGAFSCLNPNAQVQQDPETRWTNAAIWWLCDCGDMWATLQVYTCRLCPDQCMLERFMAVRQNTINVANFRARSVSFVHMLILCLTS